MKISYAINTQQYAFVNGKKKTYPFVCLCFSQRMSHFLIK
jgi:hypothetical protein